MLKEFHAKKYLAKDFESFFSPEYVRALVPGCQLKKRKTYIGIANKLRLFLCNTCNYS